MLCGEQDVFPRFDEALALAPEVGGELAATALRLARRVYWEYQRQLWDPTVSELIAREDQDAQARALLVRTTPSCECGIVSVLPLPPRW